MQLRVTQYGEPVLRQKGAPVERFDDELRKLAADMIETMYAHEGVGLAAQQVDRAIMLCVIDPQIPPEAMDFDWQLDGRKPPLELIMPMALVNPEVEILPGPPVTLEEGCLSFPAIRGEVERAAAVRVRYQDLQGASHELVTEGWLARIILHEVDHLNGILFIDHMNPAGLRSIESKVKRLKRQTRDWLRQNRPAVKVD